MTLIITNTFSGTYALMTSDTRRVRLTGEHDPVTGKYLGGKILPEDVDDAKDIKTERLTDRVLVGTGGIARLGIYLRNQLARAVKPQCDLADCKAALDSIIAHAIETKDGHMRDMLRFIDAEEGVSVFLTGFYRDNTTGIVSYDASSGPQVKETKLEAGYYTSNMIAPLKKFKDKADDMLEVPSIDDGSAFAGLAPAEHSAAMFDAHLKHYQLIHGTVSYNHPVEVSSDFLLRVIYIKDGKPAYYDTEYDSAELHALLAQLQR